TSPPAVSGNLRPSACRASFPWSHNNRETFDETHAQTVPRHDRDGTRRNRPSRRSQGRFGQEEPLFGGFPRTGRKFLPIPIGERQLEPARPPSIREQGVFERDVAVLSLFYRILGSSPSRRHLRRPALVARRLPDVHHPDGLGRNLSSRLQP